jgi:predicted MFS family arabinose efflux permease
MRTPLLFTLAIVAYFVFFGAWDVLYPALLDSIYSQVAVGVLARFDQLRSIAYTLIVIFSGYVMGASGHRTTFIIAAVSLMLSGVVILQSKTEAASSDDLEKATVASIIREDSHIRRLVLIFMLAGTGMLMMLPALPVVEVKTLNLSDASIGILLAVNSLAYIIAMEIWPRVVRNVAALFVTFSVGLTAIAVMALLYGFFPTYALLIVANVFCGIGGSSISFFWQTFSISHPDYRTEDLSSLHLFTCGVRGVYAPLLGALIIALLGVKMNFVLSAGVVLIGLLLFLIKGRDIFPV